MHHPATLVALIGATSATHIEGRSEHGDPVKLLPSSLTARRKHQATYFSRSPTSKNLRSAYSVSSNENHEARATSPDRFRPKNIGLLAA
jgi:hypothetical protein